MVAQKNNSIPVQESIVPLNRDTFLRDLLRSISGTLKHVVGVGIYQWYLPINSAKIIGLYKSGVGV